MINTTDDYEETDIVRYQTDDNYCHLIKSKLLFRQNPKMNRQFKIINNVLYHQRRYKHKQYPDFQLVVPLLLMNKILVKYHENSGHFGYQKTEEMITHKYWSKNIRQVIRAHINACLICQKSKNVHRLTFGTAHIIKVPEIPMEIINVDVLGPIKESNKNNKYIITATDRLTRWLIAMPIPNQKAETVIQFIEHISNRFNTPSQIINDRHQSFNGVKFQSYCKKKAIKHSSTSCYFSSGDGLSEVSNYKLVKVMRCYTNEQDKDWDNHVEFCVRIINQSINKTTGYSPFFLLYGYLPTNSFDKQMGWFQLSYELAEARAAINLNEARTEARNAILKAELEWKAKIEQRTREPNFKRRSSLDTRQNIVIVNT